MSSKLRKTSIATGYGTQIILTDSICQKIIDDTMAPYFIAKENYKGINIGLDSIIAKWNN